MMNNFGDFTYLRDETVDGIGPWTWIQFEKGAWEGPKQDWEKSHKEKYLGYCKKFDTVLCAGGNQGMYPRLLSEHFKTVYTFEPDALNFYCLVQNCQKESILKFQAALGSRNMMIDMIKAYPDNTGMHRVCESDKGIIPMFKVDNFDFHSLDFMQLDVEGHEIEILRGAEKTIEKHLPLISCENGNQDIEQFLAQYGYKRVDQSVSDTIYSAG